MTATLDQLIVAAKRSVEAAKRETDRTQLEEAAERHVPRGFRQRLSRVAQSGPAVIAELKKASPSKGLIRDPFHVASLATQLQANGAAALSVLTEEAHFQGSLANLCEASAATNLPCLRKDFMVDEFQMLEARANRADAVLLIVASLSQQELVSLKSAALDYGLDVLCEVHDEEELKRAMDAGFDMIGVNSRNLRTFKVDLAVTFELAQKIPSNALRVAESGIHSGEEVRRLREAGYQAFLVGESLMRAEMPGNALSDLLREAGSTQAAGS